MILKVLVDNSVDNALIVGPSGMGWAPKPRRASVPYPRELLPVLKAYMDANKLTTPLDLEEFRPYTTTSEQRAALDKFIKAATE